MDIQELIRVKRNQIDVLERHIKALERIAAEEGGVSATLTSRGSRGRRPSSGRRRRGPGDSRAAMVEKYLRSHPGPQPAKEIAAALGLKPAEVHGAIHSGLKGGRFVRGKQRATYGIGSGGVSPAAKGTSSKRKTGARNRKKTARKARATNSGARKPEPGASLASA
jgi:hypothetical protein